MFGRFGPGEIAVIVLLVLVIFGAKRLPELGRNLGLGLTNFRQALKGGPDKPPADDSQPPSPDQPADTDRKS